MLFVGSYLYSCLSHFQLASKSTVQRTVPGWVASPEKIAAMMDRVAALGLPDNCIYVFDLFSNTALRFEQFTLSLPYKASGKYHLVGNACSVLSAHLHKATTVVAAKPQAQKVVLIGESNLHNCLPHIQLASKSTYS